MGYAPAKFGGIFSEGAVDGVCEEDATEGPRVSGKLCEGRRCVVSGERARASVLLWPDRTGPGSVKARRKAPSLLGNGGTRRLSPGFPECEEVEGVPEFADSAELWRWRFASSIIVLAADATFGLSGSW